MEKRKPFDLEERTLHYSKDIIWLLNNVPKSLSNIEIAKQLIRSAGSVGANYIEANDNLGKKDFANRIRICRKEAKESRYWFKLIASANLDFEKETSGLIQEATELMNIFGAILKKTI